MEPIKRKRVTRVGSGAFSIYLPKKWIDSWAPDPDADRQVDLHVINDALMIVPAGLTKGLDRAVTSDTETIAGVLLSAYVRGLDYCNLRPADGQFPNDAVAAARDLLRHLDERIVATSNPELISFQLDPELPPLAAEGADILRNMGAKVHEMMGFAAEAVDAYGQDPDRALHAMRLLDLTQREDVQRLLYQAVRAVARIELPLQTVSDFQFLDLLASHLERMGGHLVRITDVLLAEYGLKRADLEYPRDHLLKLIGQRDPMTGPGREMVVSLRRDFEVIDDLVKQAFAAVANHDLAALGKVIKSADWAQADIGDHVFSAVVQHWGEETSESAARAAFAMSRIASLMGNVLHALQSLARHAMVLTAAEEPEP